MDPDAGREPVDRETRDLLMQARTRALARLQAACAPASRAHLEQAIAELDEHLAGRAKASASKPVI